MEPDPFSYLFQSIILLNTFETQHLLHVVSIILLLIFSGLLSGSEVAFFSLTKNDLEIIKEDDSTKGAKKLLTLLDHPKHLLSTILIANNIVNIALILVSDALLNLLVPEHLGPYVNFLITVVLVTFLLVLFGEVAPKIYANQNNILISKKMSVPLSFLQLLFKPLNLILVNSTQFIERRLEKRLQSNQVTQEDINSAIELTFKEGENAKQDIDILKGIVQFGNTSAVEIMKPRTKVVALNHESTFEQVVSLFQNESFSRVPVYKEDLDTIIGILHAKDLIDQIGNEEKPHWHNKIRPAFLIPKVKKIDDLFNDFQEKRTHIAIVVDEYGGTEGIVTLEDVLEEIFGEIQDEFDEQEEDNFDKVNDFTFDFDGITPLGDLCKVLDVPQDHFDSVREGAETIAGLILVVNGKIPVANTSLNFDIFRIVILKSSRRRIEKVRVIINDKN